MFRDAAPFWFLSFQQIFYSVVDRIPRVVDALSSLTLSGSNNATSKSSRQSPVSFVVMTFLLLDTNGLQQ